MIAQVREDIVHDGGEEGNYFVFLLAPVYDVKEWCGDVRQHDQCLDTVLLVVPVRGQLLHVQRGSHGLGSGQGVCNDVIAFHLVLFMFIYFVYLYKLRFCLSNFSVLILNLLSPSKCNFIYFLFMLKLYITVCMFV